MAASGRKAGELDDLIDDIDALAPHAMPNAAGEKYEVSATAIPEPVADREWLARRTLQTFLTATLSRLPIFIVDESGVGKPVYGRELAARAQVLPIPIVTAGVRASAPAPYVWGLLISSVLFSGSGASFLIWWATGAKLVASPATMFIAALCGLGWAATCIAGLLARRQAD